MVWSAIHFCMFLHPPTTHLVGIFTNYIRSLSRKNKWMCEIQGTLSSGNADGDGNAETCENAGERAPLWREFTNIKQHRRKPRFPPLSSLLTLLTFVLCLSGWTGMTSLKGVRNQLLIIHDEGVLNDDKLLLPKTTTTCRNFASKNATRLLAPFSLSCTVKYRNLLSADV